MPDETWSAKNGGRQLLCAERHMRGAGWAIIREVRSTCTGASVDQEGNLYVAEVANGRAQKFHPRQGANPEFIVGKPVYSAWK